MLLRLAFIIAAQLAGGEMRFSMTDKCGKRLNCWNSMPMRWRTVEVDPAGDVGPLKDQASGVDPLELVHTPQQRALSATVRSDDHRAFAAADLQVDAGEHLEFAVALWTDSSSTMTSVSFPRP